MTIDMKDFLSGITDILHRIDYIKPEDLPNIDLYMDQVTTFMDSQLEASKRYPEDKILTKTMINNYAKNNLIPPPEKKKYTKEHILCLIFIYYFKNILSISDIQRILNPITDKYFGTDREFLQTFAFICELSFDVYIKKTLIEKIIDSLPQEDKKESKKDAKKEAKKTKK